MNAIVVIPAYNPDEELVKITEELWDCGNQTVVVDDGSRPECMKIFDQISDIAIIIHHDRNMGKGAAIKTALTYIRREYWDSEPVGIMDADGQHSTEDMENLLRHVERDRNKLVLGVRKVGNDMPLRSRMGNLITRNVFRIVSGKKISDTQSGLRAFRTDMIPAMLQIPGDRYEYETNVLLYMVKEKVEIEEVAIKTIYHDNSNSCSHFRVILDSLRIYRDIFKFALFSMSSFAVDYVLFILFDFIFSGLAARILLANIAARCCSGYYNYHVNTKYVFGKKKNWNSALQYILLAGGILVGNSIILMLYHDVCGVPVYIAKIFTETTLFVISFTVQKFLIYRPEGKISGKNGFRCKDIKRKEAVVRL